MVYQSTACPFAHQASWTGVMWKPNHNVLFAFALIVVLGLAFQAYLSWDLLDLKIPVASIHHFFSAADLFEHVTTSDVGGGQRGSSSGFNLDLKMVSETEATDEPLLGDQNKIHERLIRRGIEEVQLGFGQEEIKLTRKYWELVAWFKNLPNTTGDHRHNSSLPLPPQPYDFRNRKLWDPEFEGAIDKVLAQVVWRLQLLVGNYERMYMSMKSDYKPHYEQYSSNATRAKRIFTGKISYWPDWALLPGWIESGRISGCYDRVLPASFSDLEPVCELVETKSLFRSGSLPPSPSLARSPELWNWTVLGIDIIVQIYENPFPPPARVNGPIPIPWLFYIAESPASFPFMAPGRSRFFSSYMRDAPVQHKYLKWIYYDPEVRAKVQGQDHSRRKKKSVAMLVSNCDAKNGRLVYAKKLKQYIDVDIFGGCGDDQELEPCGGSSAVSDNETCFKRLSRYRFYLAFENSNCQEYVTEKFHRNALMNGVVPVVMGASPSFYRLHAPQNSYIHVQDFESPRHLAAYLTALASNSTMYNDYFKWRETGEPAPLVATPWLCSLCGLLHQQEPLEQESGPEHSSEWIPNSTSTRNGQPLCLEEGQWYWPPAGDK